jgi:hypothetical protein
MNTDRIIPHGWDYDAFCSNLYHASKFKGMKLASKAKVPLARTLHEWLAARSRGKCGAPLQKAFYNNLTDIVVILLVIVGWALLTINEGFV